ncbi:MAG: hypothetical protein AMJ46_03025 [Latescibacteria bacterium DG_63]|nr:MAG: hypothetical protein AMJ46_03025 [Latescibacteria bacterium DG_63]
MEEALKKKLIPLAFVPLVLLAVVLVGILWLDFACVPFSVWVTSKGLGTYVVLGTLALAAAFVVFELVILLRVARIAGSGTRALLKLTETAQLPRQEIPRSLTEDVEFSVLAKRLEQLSRGAKSDVASSRRLAQLEEELQRIANAIEEVSVGSPFVPLPEREGITGLIAGLLNKVLPEFCELRKSSLKEIQAVETELRETRKVSQELAAHTERSFVESTETLVLAREVSRLTAEAREKVQAIAGKRRERVGMAAPGEEIRDAVAKVIETAARGIEELTRGIIKSNALSRSAERIANRASVLALNVAVEAAKASMPGMNVLSEEIRKLAEFARASSDESAALVGEIEAKVDSVVRTIHISQEEVRLRIRSLGVPTSEELAGEEEDVEGELDRLALRLGEATERLLTKLQELSKLTEKASREAENVSRKALATHDQTRALVQGESWKNPLIQPQSREIETLSDEDFLIGDTS